MKILTIALFFIGLCTFYSCGEMGGTAVEGSPEETMKGFIEKIQAQDFEGAKAFTNNVTDNTMDMLKIHLQILKETGKEDQIPTLFGGIEIGKAKVECTTTDKRATCKCCEEGTDKCGEITVVQEGGKWLINHPKESTVEEDESQAKETPVEEDNQPTEDTSVEGEN